MITWIKNKATIMKNIILEKAYSFAVNSVLIAKNIQESKNEYILTRQLIRCSTSIGANITESQAAESRKDFIHKLKIALKEALECRYWLNLLKDTNYLSEEVGGNSIAQLTEIIKMLIAIINRTRINMEE